MKEEDLQHGAIVDKKDERDYQYSEIAKSNAPFDWNIGFDVEDKVGKLPVKNQGQTSACGGFAWATYSYVLDETDRQEKSEKFIYAHTHVPGGGSGGRENCDFCVKKGVCNKILCPLPNPLTEAEITRTDDITALAYADATTNAEKSYMSVNKDIDSVAQAIRDNNGVVIGITGKNNGTWLTKFPSPPDNWTNSWNHWVYASGAKIINGKKFIKILNSWGDKIGDGGFQYLGEEYFNGTWVWSCWTMLYNADVKYVFTKVLRLGMRGFDVKQLQLKLGITQDGIFGNKTLSAVKNFQVYHRLVPDGIVGKNTNAVLNSL